MAIAGTVRSAIRLFASQCARWFLANYEDPVKSTPYDGAEGGYQYQCGGRYSARDELMGRFYAGLETRFRRRRLGRDEDRVHAGRLLTREETIAHGSCDPHILAVADKLPPVASSVGSSLSGLGLERVPSNVVGEAFGSC
jgi:hypothetical protein